MAMAPLSRLGAVTGDAAYFEKQWNNFNATMLEPLRPAAPGRPPTFNLFNLTDRLFYQRAQVVGTDEYWGRGNGWAMLGLIDALRFGDAAEVKGGVADPHRGEYIRVFKLFAARLVGLQGSDGKESRPVRIQSSCAHPQEAHTHSSVFDCLHSVLLYSFQFVLMSTILMTT
jgi:rhamnogalacturonyl hydrolase YesR